MLKTLPAGTVVKIDGLPLLLKADVLVEAHTYPASFREAHHPRDPVTKQWNPVKLLVRPAERDAAERIVAATNKPAKRIDADGFVVEEE